MSSHALMPNGNIERAVLSSIIFDPMLLESDYLDLKVFDFMVDYNKKVFRAIKSLEKAGKPIADDFLKIELSKNDNFHEAAFLEILSANPITNGIHYKEQLKKISKTQYFNEKKAEILNKELTAEDEIRELVKFFDSYNRATILKPLLNIVNSKNVVASEPTFYLKDFLPIQKNEINMLSASGGTGKSFVALWAAGKLTLQHDLKVFAYLSEDAVEITKHRLEIIRRANTELKNIDIDYAGKDVRPQSFLQKTSEGFNPSTYMEDFKKILKEYDVIILDPLIAFIHENENNNVEARAMFNALNEWCEQDDKTLIIIHHHSKEDRIRGASAFIDAVRLHSEIKNPTDVDRKKHEEDKKADKKNGKTTKPFNPKKYNYRIATIKKTNHFSGKGDFIIPLFSEGEPAFEVSYEGWGSDKEFLGAKITEYKEEEDEI